MTSILQGWKDSSGGVQEVERPSPRLSALKRAITA